MTNEVLPDLADQVVLITGAGRGLGRSAALHLARCLANRDAVRQGEPSRRRDTWHRAFLERQDLHHRYCWVVDIKDGQIFAIREYMDTAYIQSLQSQ